MKRSGQVHVTGIVVAAGLGLLFIAESRTCRAFLRSHVPMPGLWNLGLAVLGWQLLIAPPIFFAATIARRSPARPISIAGGVMVLVSIMSLVGLNAVFAWFMVSWGLATGWAFTM